MIFVLIAVLTFLIGFRLGKNINEIDRNYVPPTPTVEPTVEPTKIPEPTTAVTSTPEPTPTVATIEVTVTPAQIQTPIPYFPSESPLPVE